MEQSLQTTQEQLSQRVTEVVRHEQVNRKLETELKTLRDRNANSEEEIDEQKSVIDKLRKELMRVKEEHHAAVQEGLAYKQQAHKSEVELDGAREQEKMLTEQVGTGGCVFITVKNLKNIDAGKNCCHYANIWTVSSYLRLMCSKHQPEWQTV